MRLLLPAIAAAAALLLTGCSDPEPGSPLPTGGAPVTSASPSGTAISTPSTGAPEPTSGVAETPTTGPSTVPTAAPTLPPEATTNDAAGAEAFVEYWFSTLNFALSVGDAGPLRVSSAPECQLCEEYLADVDDRSGQGESVEGGRFEVEEATSPAPDGTGATYVATQITRSSGRIVNLQGSLTGRIASEATSVNAVLIREGEAWVMFGFANS